VEALLTDRFVQMTGLDIAKDHLIEIAVLITNGDLEIVAKVSAGRRMCSKLDLVLMLMIYRVQNSSSISRTVSWIT
jgi:oligoribonuclease (3'-5' exoribonuclease)